MWGVFYYYCEFMLVSVFQCLRELCVQWMFTGIHHVSGRASECRDITHYATKVSFFLEKKVFS